MKTTNRLFCSIVILLLIFSTNLINAQEAKTAKYYTVTTMNFNLDNDSDADWVAVEKEYVEKVTRKNEYLLGAGFYTHLYTSNSSDVKYVQVYGSWEDIDKSAARNAELEKEAWPDATKRAAFLKTQGNFYTSKHSDEIYTILPNAKNATFDPEKDMILYVRTSHFAYPENAPEEEFGKLRTEFVENVIQKNDLIKGYYPHRHFWGHDSTEFIEAFFVESTDDLDDLASSNWKLIEQHWPDAEARKEFNQKMNKYFTGIHGDEVYTSIEQLRK